MSISDKLKESLTELACVFDSVKEVPLAMDYHIGRWLSRFKLRKVQLNGFADPGVPAPISGFDEPIFADPSAPATTQVTANVACSNNPGDTICKPVIDIDWPCQLYTSTNGHSHLYIDYPLKPEQYDKLLSVLTEIGLYNEGCYKSFKERGFTAVRLPWIEKTAFEHHS